MALGQRAVSKRESILQHVRSQIVTRQLKPGAQLPSRELLSRHFLTSRTVVQRALDELMAEGLVRSRGSAGTFVCDTLPYLTRYGLVFEWRPSELKPWSRFWKALQHEALAFHVPGQREMHVYFAHDERAPGGIARDLAADAAAHRVAGLIFAAPPYALQGSPIIGDRTLPKVGIMADPYGGIPCVYPDIAAFFTRAMDHLVACGRRRLAVIGATASNQPSEWEPLLHTQARAHGLQLDPVCLQTCHFGNPRQAARTVRLLMRLPPAERPDALLVSDDNLVEDVVIGLIEAGVRVPEQLTVVAHCNFPRDTTDALPLVRLGFDCRELLARSIEAIDQQRQGVAPAERMLVAAVRESDLRSDPEFAARQSAALLSGSVQHAHG